MLDVAKHSGTVEFHAVSDMSRGTLVNLVTKEKIAMRGPWQLHIDADTGMAFLAHKTDASVKSLWVETLFSRHVYLGKDGSFFVSRKVGETLVEALADALERRRPNVSVQVIWGAAQTSPSRIVPSSIQ